MCILMCFKLIKVHLLVSEFYIKIFSLNLVGFFQKQNAYHHKLQLFLSLLVTCDNSPFKN